MFVKKKKIIEYINVFFYIVLFSSYVWISASEPGGNSSNETEIVSSAWEN